MSLPLNSYSQALDIVLDQVSPLEGITLPLQEAVDHVLTSDAVAVTSAPGFDNTAMDGYALIASDTKAASPDNPVRLKIVDSLPAGDDVSPSRLGEGTVVEIMTGAAVPAGATTILPVELSVQDGDCLIFSGPVEDGKHIRLKGTDFHEGTVLLAKGSRITENCLPALTAAGIGMVQVTPRSRVGWISTGRELVDDYSRELGPNQIYNSTGLFGRHAVKSVVGDIHFQQTVADDGESFRIAMGEALACDLKVIISTGAVSVGKYDFVRKELEDMGAEILLHKAKVRPGKPILFARLPGDVFFFGLPGNPVSSTMGFRMFTAPFLEALEGLPREEPLKAVLKADAAATPKFTVFMKARFGVNGQARVVIEALQGQESYRVAPMVDQNAWLIHPEGEAMLKAGDIVEFLPFLPMTIETESENSLDNTVGVSHSCC